MTDIQYEYGVRWNRANDEFYDYGVERASSREMAEHWIATEPETSSAWPGVLVRRPRPVEPVWRDVID